MEGSYHEEQLKGVVEVRVCICVGAGGKAVWGAPARADHMFRRLREKRDHDMFNKLTRISCMWCIKLRKRGTIKPCEVIKIS